MQKTMSGSRSPTKRWLTVLAVILLVIGVSGWWHLLSARLSSPYSPGREAAHVRTLARELDDGAGADMQAYFPEGEFFTWVLTGLSAGRLAADGENVDQNMAVVTAAVAATGRDEVAERFGDDHRGVPHGAFYHGWRLLLLVQQAAVTGDDGQLAEVHDEAAQLLEALDAPGEPPLTSYPGQAWPCDLVAAWAAVHQADRLTPIDGLDEATDRLLAQIDDWRDPATGLIGHAFTTTDGSSVSGPRGSSQAIINTYLRDIDPGLAEAEWASFTQQFVTREFVLMGVREYPASDGDKPGDVDSGPLIAGVSLSASAVTLGAAQANGDIALATRLNQEAELLGLPLPWRGVRGLDGRAFAFGVLPVGDAFVTAARTQPYGAAVDFVRSNTPGILWWPWFTVASIPALLGVWLLVRSRRRRNP